MPHSLLHLLGLSMNILLQSISSIWFHHPSPIPSYIVNSYDDAAHIRKLLTGHIPTSRLTVVSREAKMPYVNLRIKFQRIGPAVPEMDLTQNSQDLTEFITNPTQGRLLRRGARLGLVDPSSHGAYRLKIISARFCSGRL